MKKTYSEKLKDPRWQRKRLEILNEHDFTCAECGSKTETLHVHHKWYEKGKDPWDYEKYVYQILCETCHKKREILLTEAHRHVGLLSTDDLEGMVNHVFPMLHVGPWSCRSLWVFFENIMTDFKLIHEVEEEKCPKDS